MIKMVLRQLHRRKLPPNSNPNPTLSGGNFPRGQLPGHRFKQIRSHDSFLESTLDIGGTKNKSKWILFVSFISNITTDIEQLYI